MFLSLENVRRNFDSWVEQKPFGRAGSRKAKKQYYFPLLWKNTAKINRTKHKPQDSAYRCLSLGFPGSGMSSEVPGSACFQAPSEWISEIFKYR